MSRAGISFLTRRRALAMLAASLAPSLAEAQGSRRSKALGRREIAVETYPLSGFSILEPSRKEFGKLTFMGGMELRSKDPEFGGISSALIEPDGRNFIAITDHGHWLTGRFVAENDALKGVTNVAITPMIGPSGRRMKETRHFDSEGLTRIGKSLYVSVERSHDILKFALGPNGPEGRGTLTQVPAEMKTLDGNQGIEALGVVPKGSPHAGALIAIAERAARKDGNSDIPGFLIGGANPGNFRVKRLNNFDITDLGFLPGGDLLVLERRFVAFLGLSCRLRRIALPSIKPGATLDGEVIFEADLTKQIDNLEALMIHQGQNDQVILTLISDDNFSILQRTLVLRFSYRE